MTDDLKPEAWLVIHKQTKKRRVIDAAKHDPSSLVFWVSQEAADMHNIVPLYGRALPAVSPGAKPEAALAAQDWQPIETAPKDGTRLDLWCRRSWNPPVEFERRTSVYWCRTHQRFRTEGEFHYVEETFNPRPGERYLIPTHWRPLPAPPALIPKEGA